MKIAVAMRHAMSHVLKQRKRQSVSATSAILRDLTDSIMRNGKSAKFLKEYNTNFASKREQCQTCLSMAEREQSQDRDSGINFTNYTNYCGWQC